MSNSIVVSLQAPSTVVAGQAFTATLRLQNTGSDTWVPSANLSAQSGYKLGSYPHDNDVWGSHRVMLPGNVTPGGTVDILIAATAPMNVGDTHFQWQMVQEGVAWFGAICDAVITVAAPPPVNLSDVLSPQRPSGMDPRSGKSQVAGQMPCLWTSNPYVADGQWRSVDIVNDVGALDLVASYLWTGIQTGTVCDTHVQLSTVDGQGNERLIQALQWDHYAEPTSHQGRHLSHNYPTRIAEGEVLRIRWYTQQVAGKLAHHAVNAWFVPTA